MASELRVVITGDAESALRAVNRVTGGLGELDKAAGGSGGRIRSAFTGAFETLNSTGARIVGGLTTAFKIGAGTIVAGVATAIGLGLKRLVGIEEAQAKLRGLGHDAATVTQVMTDALASVKGTAFGLGEAATVAAAAVASGIKPGEELERYLRLTADAASIAGTSMEDMGEILNKTTASQRVMAQDLNQLTARGIPVLQWLADEYGVTAGELRTMVSEGKVDAETFRRVLEENVGGAALETGQTTMGALRNIGAAASRLGARLIGPVFGQAQGFFTGVIGWIDELTDKVGPFADRFGEWLSGAFRRVTDAVGPLIAEGRWLASLFTDAASGAEMFMDEATPLERIVVSIGQAFAGARQWIADNEELIRKVAAAAGPAVGIVAGLATSVHLASRAFRLLAAATPLGIILAIATGLVYAYQNSEAFRNVVQGAFDAVSGAISTAWGAIEPVLAMFAGWFTSGGPGESAVGGFLASIEPILVNLAAIFSGAFELIKVIVETFVKIVTGFWERFGDQIVAFAKRTWDNISRVVEGATRVIRGIIDLFVGILTGDWSRAWDGIRNIVSGAWNIINGLVRAALDVLRTVIGAALAAISQAWDAAWGVIRAALAAVWNRIVDNVRERIQNVRDNISAVTGAIKGAWETAWGAIAGYFSDRWDDIKQWATDGIEKLKEVVSGGVETIARIWGGLKAAFARPINWVIDNVINRFLSGVENIASALSFSINLPRIPTIDVHHAGGVVGEGGAGRRSLADGVGPGERLIVARDGEEVLTDADPRHVRNLRKPAESDALAETGGPFDFVAGAAQSIVSGARKVIAEVVRPAIEAAIALTETMGDRFGVPGRLTGGAAAKLGRGVLDWVAGVDAEAKEREASIEGTGWQALVRYLASTGVPHRVTSTVRPGAVTISGNLSRHARGLAVDFAGLSPSVRSPALRAIQEAFLPVAGQLAELIGPWVGMNYRQGRPHAYSSAVQRIHQDHVHAALGDGGIVTRPGLYELAEKGESEAVIPLSRLGQTLGQTVPGDARTLDAMTRGYEAALAHMLRRTHDWRVSTVDHVEQVGRAHRDGWQQLEERHELGWTRLGGLAEAGSTQVTTTLQGSFDVVVAGADKTAGSLGRLAAALEQVAQSAIASANAAAAAASQAAVSAAPSPGKPSPAPARPGSFLDATSSPWLRMTARQGV